MNERNCENCTEKDALCGFKLKYGDTVAGICRGYSEQPKPTAFDRAWEVLRTEKHLGCVYKDTAKLFWEEALKQAAWVIETCPGVWDCSKNKLIHDPKHGILTLHSCDRCK